MNNKSEEIQDINNYSLGDLINKLKSLQASLDTIKYNVDDITKSLRQEIELRQRIEDSLKKYSASVEDANKAIEDVANKFRKDTVSSLNKITLMSQDFPIQADEESIQKFIKIKNAIRNVVKTIEDISKYDIKRT